MNIAFLRRNKSSIKFILSLLIISIIIGFIIYNITPNDLKSSILLKVEHMKDLILNGKQNNILDHLGLISLLIILSLIIIGLPLSIIYYSYEGISIGYLLSLLYSYNKLKGILFGSIFIILNKIIFIFILSYFITYTINYTKRFIKSFKSDKKDIITNYLYKSFFTLTIIFLNDILVYFLGNLILKNFLFLL